VSFVTRLRVLRRAIKLRWQARRDTPVENAVRWIKAMQTRSGGLRPCSYSVSTTPEVTGYTIPTLLSLGEREFAHSLARWEMSVQRDDGGFELCGIPHAFDTAQVVRGFLSVLDEMPEVEGSLRSACEFVASHISPDGEVIHDTYDIWRLPDGSVLSEYGNLYVLPPLVQAAARLGEPEWDDAAIRALERFKARPDLVEFKPELATLSHYFGYMMEALVELGETELASRGLEQAVAIQRSDGAIPAFPGASWVCSTGIAQLCLPMYRLGWLEPADRAMEWLERAQNPTGGFYGSYGPGATYFERREILWAAKFYLDAVLARIAATFDEDVPLYEEEIDERDPRAQAVIGAVSALQRPRVLDAGCGKGRYLRALAQHCPDAELYGVDISEDMLASCPPEANVRPGSLLNTGFEGDFFDCVVCVEALEHALLPENAIREMTRVLRPGGTLLIIDKSSARLGAMSIKPWEQWFNPSELTRMLRAHGHRCSHRPIGHGSEGRNGLFVLWEGAKGP
jgi:malonyl-CoA O-methyltransferase